MASNNAFWREVIDYLPNLILVFRVDEKEHTQLIFCNNKIREELGYSAREFVLASESEGQVQKELDSLIDEVARRSHDVENIDPRLCSLTHKEGKEKDYVIDFKLFKTKKGSAQLIAVELRGAIESSPFQKREEESFASNDSKSDANRRHKSSSERRIFVCESEIMKSVLETIRRNEKGSKRHLLLQGEPGTGKKTLVDRIIDRQTAEEGDWKCITIGKEENIEKESLAGTPSASQKLMIRIPHIAELSADQQQELQELLTERKNNDSKTWLLATTTHNLEEQVNKKHFMPSLYYRVGFETVLVPPLRHRPDDIRAAANAYIRRAGDLLHLNITKLDPESLQKLEDQKWPGNFPQLYKVLRRSLLESDEGSFELRLKEKQQYKLFPEQKISEDAVLSFDQMNRTYLERVLELTDGKIYGDDGAAALLELKPTTLQSKLKRLGIK